MTVEVLVRDRTPDEMHTVEASATVTDAIELMSKHDVGAVLIMTEDGLVGGIFTERDVVMRVLKEGLDPDTTPLSMVMTREVRFVSPGTTYEAALSLMLVQRCRHLLVIDGPRVFGLISIRDLAQQMVRFGHGRFEAAVRGAGGTETV